MTSPIRVLIAEDHTIVRQGLARLLSDQHGLEVVGEATNGLRAVAMTESLKPDILIMDIAMPKMNGVEASKKIRKLMPKIKILILSMYSHEHYIHELLGVGVSGYLLKDSDGRDIIKAINDAMKNKTFLSPVISKIMAERDIVPQKGASREDRFKQLTNREREVFQLIAEGHSTRDIAEMLFVSVSTIKTHRAKIMEKLGAKSAVQLAHVAIHLGLVDPEH